MKRKVEIARFVSVVSVWGCGWGWGWVRKRVWTVSNNNKFP